MIAVFSPCRRYRYTLRREWAPELGFVNFIMLNPSTADEKQDDPTVRRCIEFAISWGYGGLIVTNIFAFRSTDPKRLRMLANPVGLENDRYIWDSALEAGRVICAWGAHGTLLDRDKTVIRLLQSHKTLHCLGCTQNGYPKHPLYVSGNVIVRPLLEESIGA